jgi:hypothetical protein
MKKAGLNPILAYQQGPNSVPNAPTENPASGLPESVSSAYKLGTIEKARVANETRSTDADVALKDAQIETQKATTAKIQAETPGLAAYQASQTTSNLASAQNASTNARLTETRIPLGKLEENFWRTVTPFVGDLLKALGDFGTKVRGMTDQQIVDAITEKLTGGAKSVWQVLTGESEGVKREVGGILKRFSEGGTQKFNSAKDFGGR